MNNIEIRKMTYDDIPFICKVDNDESEKNVQYLKNNLDNQENNKCLAIVAVFNNQVSGYAFLYYECKWGGLKNQGLPSVVDLIVFETFRRNGIATAIMDYVEKEAANYNSRLYLDVCLNGEYGPAQCFYIKRGYIPDGAGAYYEQEVLGVNASCKNNDELTLCLVKEL